MANKYFDGVVTNTKVNEEVDNKLIEETIGLKDVVENYMNGLEVSKAIASIFDVLRNCNKYIDKIFNQINTDNISYDSTSEFGGYKSGTRVNKAEVLFQRIEN